MQPLKHDPNLSNSTAPLLNKEAQVLTSKMQSAVTAVSGLKDQGKPVVIVVRENETAMKLSEMMLARLINAHEVATHWPDADCHSIAHRFNNGTYGIDAVITTFAALKIPGPHFGGGCNHGIMLELPDDFEEYDMARNAVLPRNETEGVLWSIYQVPGSLDTLRDLTIAQKEVKQLVSDLEFYPTVMGHLRSILCFYNVALRMGQAESRYPRDRVHWSYMETKEIRREGLFYFAVGKFVTEHQAYTGKLTVQSTMEQIARS